jgi:hypothetical protein
MLKIPVFMSVFYRLKRRNGTYRPGGKHFDEIDEAI